MTASHELDRERRYVSRLYDTIAEQRREAIAVLRTTLADQHTGFQALFERDRLTEALDDRLLRLNPDMPGLCFGKLVAADSHAAQYIGRVALLDDEGEPLLIDWRAPVAEPFYRATAVNPMGMLLRRHLIMVGRELVGLEDDLLTIDADDQVDHPVLVGEGALMAALARERTGYMADIVATIQRDQDEIIRAPMRGTLVVTGGPGTGKTVVALHRAAYLLYTYRERIANNGILFVGPSNLFLRYVERVLPTLGESAVMFIDWSDLLPGITGVVEPDPRAADVKGSLLMVDVLRRAVRYFERAPAAGIRILGPDGESLHVPGDTLARLRREARAGGATHHQGRARFTTALIRRAGLHDMEDLGFHDASERSIRDAVDQLWPRLSPEQLLRALYATDRVLTAAANGILDDDEWPLLRRTADAQWTIADLPLLDELRIMLGETARPRPAPTDAQHEAEREDAIRGIRDLALSLADAGGGEGGANLGIGALVNPETLLQRYQERERPEPIAVQARRDPTWRFAHIVVDEAQDVSPMQWRALARRCQSTSMTIVGDPDQMTRPSDGDWIERVTTALDIDSCDEHTLHVNYRTPSALVQPARQLHAVCAGTGVASTRYVRSGDTPWAHHCDTLDEAAVRRALDRGRSMLGERGRLAVISSASDAALVAEIVAPGADVDALQGASRLTQSVAAFVATEVKGLEFDAVIVVNPAAIAAECGWRQLYVVLTRPTTHLGLLLVGELADIEEQWLADGTVALAESDGGPTPPA